MAVVGMPFVPLMVLLGPVIGVGTEDSGLECNQSVVVGDCIVVGVGVADCSLVAGNQLKN
jgi:hypothetical protein